MGELIFSCGHMAKEDEMGVDIAIKAQDREGKNAVDYAHVCEECYIWYRNSKLLLYNETEMDKWMRCNHEGSK